MSGDPCLVPELPSKLCQLKCAGTSFSDRGRRRSISLRPEPGIVAVVACKSSPSNSRRLCTEFKRNHGFTLVFKSCERLDLRDLLAA